MTKKRPHKLSSYTRALLSIVDQYTEQTGELEPDLYEVAKWAAENDLMDTPVVDVTRIMSRALARACRQDYIVDENGEPVRRRHAVKETRGDKQLTFWPLMENMTPEKFRVSLTARRNGCTQDVLQMERDKRYFNTHYNPGDPIQMDFDFNADVEEHFMPSHYPDSPPE
jgi:hypothetical protein